MRLKTVLFYIVSNKLINTLEFWTATDYCLWVTSTCWLIVDLGKELPTSLIVSENIRQMNVDQGNLSPTTEPSSSAKKISLGQHPQHEGIAYVLENHSKNDLGDKDSNGQASFLGVAKPEGINQNN